MTNDSTLATTASRPPTRGRPAKSGATRSAVDLIRDHILNLSLAPGARIDDKLLMEQYGLGRTPAREAFNRLAAEGFIIIQRNKGAYVRPLDIPHIRQFFDAYGASERLVGYFCQTQDPGLVHDLKRSLLRYEEVARQSLYLDMTLLNSEFHKRIAQATHNGYIYDFASRLYNHARRLSYFIYLMPLHPDHELRGMQNSICGDHHEIFDAITAHDNEALVRALTVHTELFHHWVMRAIGYMRGNNAPLPQGYEQQ